MNFIRIIPSLLLSKKKLVKGKKFTNHINAGYPSSTCLALEGQKCDEIFIIDLDSYKSDKDPDFDSLSEISKNISTPITFGGGIKNLQDVSDRIVHGADKVSLNNATFSNPNLVTDAVREFGSQAIIASIDAYHLDGKLLAFNRSIGGAHSDFFEHIRLVQDLGVGEILLNSVNRDGMKCGYDIDLINKVVNLVNIPVIAIGGAGNWEDLDEVFEHTNVDAVSAANIFQWQEQSVDQARRLLFDRGHNIRPPLN